MNFHQRWWELYLTHTLLHAGVHLVRRDCRHPKQSGPDLLAQVVGMNLWIEAVSASAGEGPDAVRSGGPSKGPKPFPDQEIMLRFLQAFSVKARYHAKCIKRGWANESEAYVIALNGALAERAYPCLQRFPRIVSVLLVGLEKASVEVEFDLDGTTSRAGEMHYEFQHEVEKKSKNTVPLAAFLEPANSCVSAVLYSTADAYTERGSILVLNPIAKVPLPEAFLPCLPRYWADLRDSILHLATHATGFSPAGA